MFVRRVYVDTIGLLPTEREVRDFLADQNPGKRRALIEALLAREEFADYWAMKWCDLLRVSAERNLRTKVLRKLCLVDFVAYKPEFDEAAFARMTAAGEQAWAGIAAAAQWVREQRG